MKQTWWKEAVAYQIYPRSFMDSNGDGIGDLKGITQKLDYLKELGIDVIWICPMFKSPNDDNGYDISDYQDIMDEFGTMEDFDELLREVHKRGMKLILDLVVNHSSDEHSWFVESRSSRDNAKRDWYIWRDGKNGKEPNNWESIFSGSAWKYDENTQQYYLHLFSTKQPDLNWENKELREAVYSMINWWLDKGIDGFRVDAITHLKKKEGFPNMPNEDGREYVSCFPHITNMEGIDLFLSELRDRTFSKYDIMTVGEANGVGLDDAEKWIGEDHGYFNMIFQFEHLGLWDKGTNGKLDVQALKRTFSKWQYGLEGRGWNALFIENHDQPRSVSTWGDENYRVESAKSLAAMYFLMKGTPYIYQGQEIGMTNVKFPSIYDYNDVGMINFYNIETSKGRNPKEIMEIIWKSGRDNSRTPMQWNDSKNGGFSINDKTWFGVNPNYKIINVDSQLDDVNSIYHFYKSLISLRKQYQTLIYGTYELVAEHHDKVYAYTRTLENEKFLIVSNLTNDYASVEIPDNLLQMNHEFKLGNYEGDKTLSSILSLKPFETRIYRFF